MRAVGSAGVSGGSSLMRDVAAQLRVVGQVDFTHAAGPQSRADLVATEPQARRDRDHRPRVYVCPATFAQLSLSDTVRLKTGAPGLPSGSTAK